MPVEKIDTLVVGGGQAGVAMSEHLGAAGVPHLVLEKSRIAERWRTGRWDGLVANGPAWHDRFPNRTFTDIDPESFPPKDAVADYLEAYAEQINAPIRCGVEVTRAERIAGIGGFLVQTTGGEIEARNVICATGAFQHPVIPPIVPESADVTQIHSFDYRNPDQLPEGAVLVVGSGSSGAQIAQELAEAGRKVYLSVGPHDRPPRSYRGRDYCWWLGVLGLWDIPAMAPGTEHVTISVSGAHGGQTIDFRRLAAQGITLVGMTRDYDAGVMRFAPDLVENVAAGDAYYLELLDAADAYAAQHGLDLPPEEDARRIGADPDCLTHPILELDLQGANVQTILWATGFARDYGWLKADVFDEKGTPIHQRGVATEPGIFFLGLPWQSRRGSSFIWGVWHDAKHIADQIVIQRGYLTYHEAALASAKAEAD